MTYNTFGVGAAPPPPQPPGQGRRAHIWPLLLAAGATGAVLASVTTAAITVQARDSSTPSIAMPAPVTVTVAAPTPTTPAPLPPEQANRQTCQEGWLPAGQFMDSATESLDTLPKNMQVNDPAVHTNADWSAAVAKAGDFYHRASDALKSEIAPGTTPILFEAARTAVQALRHLGDATSTQGDINGPAFGVADAAAAQVGVLCARFAPI